MRYVVAINVAVSSQQVVNNKHHLSYSYSIGYRPTRYVFPTDEDEFFSNAETKQKEETTADKPICQLHENGLVSENQLVGAMIPASSMMQTETFCPHCGKKVRVGVILLGEGN